MYQKQEVRDLIKKIRNSLSSEFEVSNSREIWDKIFLIPEFAHAAAVYCYVDFNHEVRTRDNIIRLIMSGKRVAVPRIDQDEMNFYYIRNLSELKEGRFGICEPVPACSKADEENALIIVPGVAFDIHGNRIGYGKSFYDRFLKKETGHFTIAPAYEFQVFHVIPHDDNDKKVHIIVTENETYRL